MRLTGIVPLVLVRLVVVVGLTSVPSAASAQGELNGAVAGTVRDATGAVLPGVTVEASSPALIEKTRTSATDAQGQYRIVDLRPGVYTVTFTLTGFSTIKRDAVELTTGFTATLNVVMSVGAVEETITVTGASPMVDVQNVRTQTVVSRQVLDALPTAKDLAGFAISTPGADGGVAARGVGGIKGEGNYALQLHGAAGGHTTQDGMMVESPVGAGTGRGYFTSQVLIQEVVLYAVASAETESGGLNVNVVTRDGGNRFTGSANVAYAGENLQQSNLTDGLRARGIRDPNRLNHVYDVGGGLGGPLKRDRAWVFAAGRKWGAEERVAGLYFNKLAPDSLFYEPDLARPAVAPNNQYDTSIKVTARWATHKITGSNSQQYKCNCYIFLGATGLNAAAVRTPEATSHSKAPWPGSFVRQATWSFPATNRLLLEAGWGQRRQDTFYERPDEASPTGRSVADIGLGLEYGGKINGPNWLLEQGRGIQVRHSTRFVVSYVTGAHQVKAGFTKAWGSITINAQPNFPVQFTFRNRAPIGLTQIKAPHTEDNRLRAQDAIFVQDQWTLRRLTFNAGLRFDYHNAYNPSQALPATAFTNAFQFDPRDNVPNWKDLNPRLGAAYDLFGDARSALKVSINRYVVSDSLTLSQAVNPVNAIASTTTRTWNDFNSNYVPDCDLRSPLQNGECGPMANQRFGTQIPTTQYLDDVLTGWHVRPSNWQLSASLQQELRPNLSMTAGYFRTWHRRFRATDNLAVAPSDFDQFCVVLPTNPRIPGGGGNELCGLYDLNPSRFGQVNNVVTQASKFGEQSQTYNGVDLTLNARFGAGGLLAGGVSFGRTSVDDCGVRPDSPERLFCDRTPPWTNETYVKLAGSYPLPWGLSASATFQNLPGILYQANVVYTNSQIASSLGRNLSACGTAVTCTATRTVTVTEPGSLAEDRLKQLDVRLAKTLRIGGLRLKPAFDVYNLFNASTILRVNNTYSARWPQPTDLLGGRLFKLSADIDF